MKKSPKTVRIDLLSQSQKRSKSPSPNNSKSYLLKPSSHQFSFSHQDSPFLQSSSKERQRQLARKLFSDSPKKAKSKNKSPQKYKLPKNETNQYVASKDPSYKSQGLYRKRLCQEELLKKPLEKLKRTFFTSVRDNKQRTVRTLKQIGRYAQKRSRQRANKDYLQKENTQKPRKPISVQFYGFDPLDQRPYSPSKHSKTQTQETWDDYRNRQVNKSKVNVDEGTYVNFQKQVKEQLKAHDQAYSRIDIDNPKIKYSLSPQKPQPSYQNTSVITGIQNINEIQIDAICQIFELCEKYEEGERLILNEFYLLLQEFQRLYFIKIIQQSEANGLSHEKIKINENGFYELLKRFEQNFKMVFYRRQACDIYDCLYYLKESHRLDKVCSLFLGLKKILNL